MSVSPAGGQGGELGGGGGDPGGSGTSSLGGRGKSGVGEPSCTDVAVDVTEEEGDRFPS